MTPLLDVRGVTRRYVVKGGVLGAATRSVTAVDGVNLTVARGDCGLVGESGCGKSTLARCVAGLERPNAGTGCGRPGHPRPGDGRNLPRLVQMVFQDPFSSLNPRRSVGWSVAEGFRPWAG
jgi:ABC-type glutathione transport system ATPase component